MKSFLKQDRPRRNSETWQIIYIDLMTNVMVFFIILWSINQGRQVKIAQKAGDYTSHIMSLPGDVLFPPGKSVLSLEGQSVFKKLFSDEKGAVINFESDPLMKRFLVIHGHTDGDGTKDDNFQLGFDRALAAYHEIMRYSKEIPYHVVLCTHADNSPVEEVPIVSERLGQAQSDSLRAAKMKNRRITIEDKLESRVQAE